MKVSNISLYLQRPLSWAVIYEWQHKRHRQITRQKLKKAVPPKRRNGNIYGIK